MNDCRVNPITAPTDVSEHVQKFILLFCLATATDSAVRMKMSLYYWSPVPDPIRIPEPVYPDTHIFIQEQAGAIRHKHYMAKLHPGPVPMGN